VTQFSLLTLLFDQLPIGLIVLDARGQVVVFNRAEEKLAARSRERVLGASFFDEVAPCMNVRELGHQFKERIGRAPIDETVEMSFAFPHAEYPRDVSVRMCSLDVDDAPHAFLLVEDISHKRSAARMREQLQSLLVHDLKNPLSAVTMNLQLLEELSTVRDNADAMESVHEALAASSRLGKMMLDLLDISRLETASMPLRRTQVDVDLMLARVHNDNRAAARMSGSTISVTPGGIIASFDENLVIRALDNLVENATRHARTIVLSSRRDRGGVSIDVSDDGPGIPEEIRGRLFEKYVSVSAPGGSVNPHNRGLGLTFVRLAAQQHGGDAEVVCPPGGGSRFTFRILEK